MSLLGRHGLIPDHEERPHAWSTTRGRDHVRPRRPRAADRAAAREARGVAAARPLDERMDVPPNPHRAGSPTTGMLVLASPCVHGDVARLVERLAAVILTCDAPTIACDAHDLPASLVSVEALARLQLAARRRDRRIRLDRVSPELQRLLELVGLAGVVSVAAAADRKGRL